ncbi:MAG: glycosyltransferase [Thermodesulfobacteriota bacterium]
MSRPDGILLLNTLAGRGGAARIATALLDGLRAEGRQAWLAVRGGAHGHEGVMEVRDPSWLKAWARAMHGLGDAVARAGADEAGRFIRRWLSHPVRQALTDLGVEPFNYPGSRVVLRRLPRKPGLIHAHNLHGWWFDLSVLSAWSRQAPVGITLHDAWLLSGHCAHSLGCGRWLTGCGECPGLEIYPRVERDATRLNHRRKGRILGRGHFYVAAPSRWLLDKASQSLLAPAARSLRVIPNGVDTACFSPGSRDEARAALGLGEDLFVALFVGEDPRESPWRDFDMLRKGFASLRESLGDKLLLLALGGKAPEEEEGGRVRVLPYADSPSVVARLYRAADVYVHCARDDTFPTAVLEAMACGLPVAGTRAGGLPEQVAEGETGFLVPPGDHRALARVLLRIARDRELADRLGDAAARRVRENFTLERMLNSYRDWYAEISGDFEAKGGKA